MKINVYEEVTVDLDYSLQDLTVSELLEMLREDNYEIDVDLTIDVSGRSFVDLEHTFDTQITIELSRQSVINALTEWFDDLNSQVKNQGSTIAELRNELYKLKESSIKTVEVLRPVG